MVKVTPGFNLPAKFILHTVGPDMRLYNQELGDALLTSCYAHCMAYAITEGLKSIAFPAISTGIFGFDKKRAARIAAETVLSYNDETDMDVTFACFGDEDTTIVNLALEAVDNEIHHIQWSIGEYPRDDDDADFVNDLDTDAPDGTYDVFTQWNEKEGRRYGVVVKDGKFVLEPTLRACAIARNQTGYWGHFLEALEYHDEDGPETGHFEAYFGS